MEEPPPIPEPILAPEPQPALPATPKMSLPARLLNVFAVPGEVFEDVKASVFCSSNWLIPALLFLAVS